MINRKKILAERASATNIDNSNSVDSSFSVDFSKIRIGTKTLEDAILDLSSYKKIDSKFGDKENILKIIQSNDFRQMREISNFFFKASGMYSRLCKYMATMYRYD